MVLLWIRILNCVLLLRVRLWCVMYVICWKLMIFVVILKLVSSVCVWCWFGLIRCFLCWLRICWLSVLYCWMCLRKIVRLLVRMMMNVLMVILCWWLVSWLSCWLCWLMCWEVNWRKMMEYWFVWFDWYCFSMLVWMKMLWWVDCCGVFFILFCVGGLGCVWCVCWLLMKKWFWEKVYCGYVWCGCFGELWNCLLVGYWVLWFGYECCVWLGLCLFLIRLVYSGLFCVWSVVCWLWFLVYVRLWLCCGWWIFRNLDSWDSWLCCVGWNDFFGNFCVLVKWRCLDWWLFGYWYVWWNVCLGRESVDWVLDRLGFGYVIWRFYWWCSIDWRRVWCVVWWYCLIVVLVGLIVVCNR